MSEITSLHRIDKTNVGDLVSTPVDYFEFPGFKVEKQDILTVARLEASNKNILVGGGGLLDEFFYPALKILQQNKQKGKLIIWGGGQQLDYGAWHKEFWNFNYEKFLSGFDLIGIRDYGFNYRWVPCASCMHAAFDKPREIKHRFVVYSHKARPIPITDFPALTNETDDLDSTLDFLGAAETIITSSYHGMYWGLLLGRRVLVFPFNSKFFTAKHQPTLYPAVWSRRRNILSWHTPKKGLKLESVKGWRILAGAARIYPEALEECRAANRLYYSDVMNMLEK